VAIDDIKIEAGPCTSFGSCSFEGNEYCFWENVKDKRDQWDWEFGSYKTGSANTGPP